MKIAEYLLTWLDKTLIKIEVKMLDIFINLFSPSQTFEFLDFDLFPLVKNFFFLIRFP